MCGLPLENRCLLIDRRANQRVPEPYAAVVDVDERPGCRTNESAGSDRATFEKRGGAEHLP